MATYYVRKSGNDADAGTSPATAKQTIRASIALLASGGTDTIYIGPGVYREEVMLYRDGQGVGSEHQIVGDIFGDFTTDAPGLVRVSASSDDDFCLRSATVVPMASNVRLRNLVLHGGRATGAGDREGVFLASQAGRAVSNVVVEDCFVDPAGMRTIFYMRGDGSAGRDMEIEFRRSFVRNYVNWHAFLDDGNGSHVFRIKGNSAVFEGAVGEDTDASMFLTNGGSTIEAVLNRSYVGPVENAVFRHFSGLISTTVSGCVMRLGQGAYDSEGAAFNDFREYTAIEGAAAPAASGNNLKRWSGDTLLWSLMRHHTVYQALNSDTAAPGLAYDVLGHDAPLGGGHEMGPAENLDYPDRDTSIFGTASPSARTLSARRYFEPVFWGLRSGEVSWFRVNVRYNSSYTVTPKPRLIVKADLSLGIGSDSTAEAGAASLNAFSLISASVTPNADGVAEVWLRTYSNEAGAQAWFDDFSGPAFTT